MKLIFPNPHNITVFAFSPFGLQLLSHSSDRVYSVTTETRYPFLNELGTVTDEIFNDHVPGLQIIRTNDAFIIDTGRCPVYSKEGEISGHFEQLQID